jgi:chromosomal replication initiation ATPase DnaA
MHFSSGNEPLGLVEEAQRRREIYARYIERRVAALLESPPTRAEIERQVAALVEQRVAAEIRRRAAERTAARIRELRQLSLRQGPAAGVILEAAAKVTGFTIGDLIGPRREANLVLARQVTILLLTELRPDLSRNNIGRIMGGRDQQAIEYARDSAREHIADPISPSARWRLEVKAELER